jgi:hypothetical protein
MVERKPDWYSKASHNKKELISMRSSVVRFETVRLMLALSALKNWHMEAVDVKTAFLYGKLDKEIYMQQPEGFRLKGKGLTKVLRLHRAIYGLKQAALAWWKELECSMK